MNWSCRRSNASHGIFQKSHAFLWDGNAYQPYRGRALPLPGNPSWLHRSQTQAAMLEGMLDSVVAVDRDQLILFANQSPDIRVIVGYSGTGGGMKQFTAGELDKMSEEAISMVHDALDAFVRLDIDSARDVIVSQGIMLDRVRHHVSAGDLPLDLTPNEFNLLAALLRHLGRAFTRNELIDLALGDDAIVLERTIDVHIRALRKKLGSHAALIQTVRSVGYRLRDARN